MVMADRLALMDAGRVVQVGTPAAVYARPNSRFSAAFLGGVNLFEGRVQSCSDGLVRLDLPELSAGSTVPFGRPLEPGQAVCLAVRPERIELHAEPPPEAVNLQAVVVEDIGFRGSQVQYQLRLAGGRLIDVLVPGSGEMAGLQPGDAAWISWQPQAAVLLTE